MKAFPIIPIWLMIFICAFLFLVSFKNSRKNGLEVGIIILLFLINLRVMLPTTTSKELAYNLDVLFVIDNTISMNALDYNGTNTRLTGVKADCKYIIDQLNGARFSIITFHNTSKIVTPYTKDTNLTIEAIDIMMPIEELYAKGSSLNTPIDDILTSLQSSKQKNDRTRIIFFISDGEITDDSTLASYQEIKKYITNGAVLGYGTKKGGYMKTTDKYTGTQGYIMDSSSYSYEKAISKIDETTLSQIARDMNIDYISMEKQNNLNNKLKEIQNLTTNQITESDKRNYKDTYYFLAIPLLILLTIWIYPIRGEIL